MSVITIPRVLREKLGEDGAEALVNIINETDSTSRRDLATKADLSEEVGKLRLEIEKSSKENIKWMFLFWIGQIAVMVALLKIFVVK
ncbi:MAG: hypothetical protein L7F77_07340 [Candidatus Magnetominusculus sp. LBB02]|nr:hypothetical protein [Candidatus Magnetominusculus sp. LBB02]